ncbi:3'(2'),5'-bisphosphate nucleotidase CysQ [Pelagibacteraceae bacterium]|nr:3'(2'),5'-bisphosphate nucleotidase CysQ [Pelagibacteraceae bacterium]
MNLELHKSKNILKILNIAIDAGKEIQKVYKKSFNVEIKDDNSPITEADIRSNNLILNRLKSYSPNVPILSEESLVGWQERKTWNSYWLIDPLDGTKEFIKKNGEFTVNIALIKNNSPIFGIIYAPAKSLLYYALKNYGAYKLITESNIESTKDFIKINSVKDKSNLTKVIGSRSHSNKDFDNWINDNCNNFELIKIGSSLKFCYLAESKASIYPRLGPTSEWDIAAGHIILEEAGGSIKDFNKDILLYNTKESVINPNFIAKI